ncbi:hypothetical protein F5B22DRAFT_632029 [Xylaria bambusicola]|uniref:uncharacterized protein n=1 Tax=Xylaria bambusicola TaxID=326684 RepID=UPI002007CFD6|nr:uncharacterized protein F5B22DRAFT_632029 [Xylaria bambusicola]KAI0502790.1 hypothetical protein F5B22DRAFT_632029 [Xylaria bambusicola]
MTQAPPRRSRIEIPLPSKPRDYRPGDGPPLAPIRVNLEHDTDAFIIEKRVLPGKPINGDLKLELYYIVGWPNLPNARVAILATKILDYVSPWTLEDWEYEQSLERDKEEEERSAAEKRKQEERAKALAASTPGTGTSTPATPGQKKRGRPSKAEMRARQLAQQASFGKEDLANVPLPPTKPTGPSLSTPKKKLAQVSTDLEDLEETDMNEAILRQLKGGDEDDRSSESTEDLSSRPDTLGNGNGSSLEAFPPGPSSRGHAELFVPNLLSSAPDEISRSVSPVPLARRKWTPLNAKPKLTTHVPVPTYPKPSRMKKPPVAVGKTITPVPAPSYPNPKPKAPKRKHIPTVTPVPVPSYPNPKPKAPKQKHIPTVTPVPTPHCPVPKPKEPEEVAFSRVVPPKPPHAIEVVNLQWVYKRTHGPPGPVMAYDMAIALNDFNVVRPADHDHRCWSTTADIGIENDKPDELDELDDLAHTSSKKEATPVAKPKSSRKRKAQPEEEWEVECLEDSKLSAIDGVLVRHYLVRWAGDWPADQNPTWEHEDNIPPALIREYFGRKERERAPWNGVILEPLDRPLIYGSKSDGQASDVRPSKGHASKERASKGHASKRRFTAFKGMYSNVAEAFEGDASGGLGSSSLEDQRAQDGEDDAEEYLQVTEQNQMTRPMHKLRADASLLRELTDSILL